MKHWPVPDSYSKIVPASGSPGSFWEDRGDRRHCGIDIYAPEGSGVLSIEDGTVIGVGRFTSPHEVPYWNRTCYILIQNESGLVCKYAELGDMKVKKGDRVKSGKLIGHVGLVLDADKITAESPEYIQKLKHPSMLHFELYKSEAVESHDSYLGGNWFVDAKHENLLDPYDYMKSTL